MKKVITVLGLISHITPRIIQLLVLIKAKNTKEIIDLLVNWSIELMDEYQKTRPVNDWKEEQVKHLNNLKEEVEPR